MDKKVQKTLKDIFVKVKACLRSVKNVGNSGPFHKPVNPVHDAAPNYYDVVKNPMDLSSMLKKINSRAYASPMEAYADFKLMIDNCKLYNKNPEHPIRRVAEEIWRLWVSHWDKLEIDSLWAGVKDVVMNDPAYVQERREDAASFNLLYQARTNAWTNGVCLQSIIHAAMESQPAPHPPAHSHPFEAPHPHEIPSTSSVPEPDQRSGKTPLQPRRTQEDFETTPEVSQLDAPLPPAVEKVAAPEAPTDDDEPERVGRALLEAADWYMPPKYVSCRNKLAQLLGGHCSGLRTQFVKCLCRDCECKPDTLGALEEGPPGSEKHTSSALMDVLEFCAHAGVSCSNEAEALEAVMVVIASHVNFLHKLSLPQYWRLRGEEMGGERLVNQKFWSYWYAEFDQDPTKLGMGTWFHATIQEYLPRTGEHVITYDEDEGETNEDEKKVFLSTSLLHFGPQRPGPRDIPNSRSPFEMVEQDTHTTTHEVPPPQSPSPASEHPPPSMSPPRNIESHSPSRVQASTVHLAVEVNKATEVNKTRSPDQPSSAAGPDSYPQDAAAAARDMTTATAITGDPVTQGILHVGQLIASDIATGTAGVQGMPYSLGSAPRASKRSRPSEDSDVEDGVAMDGSRNKRARGRGDMVTGYEEAERAAGQTSWQQEELPQEDSEGAEESREDKQSKEEGGEKGEEERAEDEEDDERGEQEEEEEGQERCNSLPELPQTQDVELMKAGIQKVLRCVHLEKDTQAAVQQALRQLPSEDLEMLWYPFLQEACEGDDVGDVVNVLTDMANEVLDS